MTEYRVILITCRGEEEADRIGSTLIEEHLAACVNIVPKITSIYRWEGEVCRDLESLLIVKAREGTLEKLEERVKSLHSYDLPEVIALPVSGGSEDYLDWVKSVC